MEKCTCINFLTFSEALIKIDKTKCDCHVKKVNLILEEFNNWQSTVGDGRTLSAFKRSLIGKKI